MKIVSFAVLGVFLAVRLALALFVEHGAVRGNIDGSRAASRMWSRWR